MPEIHFKCLKKLFEETGMESSMIFPTCVVLFFQQMFVSLAVTFYLCVSINILRNMKNYLLLSILCLAGILMSCTQKHTRYRIGVSQCSDDEWRHKMNNEIVREALFYDGVEVEIRTAKDNNRNQIADIKYFIDKKVDLLIVAPNEAAAITPVVEKAYRQGIPVVVIDRKILSDKYTAFVGADNYEIGKDVGQYILNRLHGKGKVLEITGLEGSTPAMERHKGLTDVLKEEPGIEITASVDGAWLQSVAGEKMDSVFQTNKNIDLVFAQNDRMAIGAYLSARQQQLEKEMLFVGIDALPGKEYGVEQIINGVLDATFIYPTGGDKVVQVAMDILEKRPYERDTKLSTALVDKTNARVMQLQTDHITEQDGKIERLNNQVNEYLSRYSAQTMFLYACLIILLLFAALLAIIVRAYWTKNRMNMELSRQKKKLEEQRDQLISLSKQLEEATHAKLVFFTNVSHDFRTPLTLVADPVEQLLEDKTLTPRQQSLLKVVHKNVHILLRLVNQILDFRKYENDKLELVRANMNLRVQLQEWSHSFQTLALKKHIHFVLEVNDDRADYLMAVDAEKMERVYFNLLSNAFKFTPENGTITVTLSTLTKEEGGRYARLVVADTGSGISVQHIRHIFDRFYQIDVNHAGSGIGLALAKAFVELHGGEITVDSVEGKGTVFTVDIPMTVVEEPSADLVQEPRITQQTVVEELEDMETEEQIPDENKECILIIDDNADVRDYVKSLLKEEYTVIEAPDGRAGLKKAMKYVPDAIICDVMMPVMDGLECCRKLKTELQTSHIPVMLLTACSLDEQRIQGFECGADSYISKPFNSKLLLVRLRNLMDNHKRLKQFFGDKTTLSKEPVSDVDKGFVDRFRELIEENLADSELSVEDLGSKMGLSRVQLYRKIKALTNYSPNELVRIARLKKAASLLASSEKTISEITYEVGFTSPSYFTKCYKDYFGESPTDFLKRRG
ncbi:ATPase/histidine kinase/DNA gyrase B/HSP90 domain protein [Phocaeicola dorei DSM 17855]|jgi:signal transduction histidine kinase/DNA-binding response OmpR family regulator/ABC-type xylose transport system substrate-binding protein|uniref:histidine kinase n=4 Tax=Phocaeicola dorei TaxID=357276 RepID=B6VSP4_9BACT|nr:ATPase/histidine kinase/DNA gyrase B/HSP90 domain protein [Phocaeicola dorei DSM 17855]